MTVTLIIRPALLTFAALRLDMLAKRVHGRTLSVSFAESEGEFSEELAKTAQNLYETGLAFEEIVNRTATVLKDARDSFVQADTSAAGQFKNG